MKKLLITMAACSAISLSACTTLDAYTGEKKVNNASKGAAIGAGIAAIIAAIDNKDASSKKRKERILKAAGGGAIIGGGVGVYMDSQEKKLREKLVGSGVQVQRDGDNINLIMPGNITFATGSSNVNTRFFNVLDSVALVVNEFKKTYVAITGYTDSTGAETFNQQLSQKRAQSVAGFLASKNVLQDRMMVKGMGESNPIGDNSTAAGREQNRRVEITLVPITEE